MAGKGKRFRLFSVEGVGPKRLRRGIPSRRAGKGAKGEDDEELKSCSGGRNGEMGFRDESTLFILYKDQ